MAIPPIGQIRESIPSSFFSTATATEILSLFRRNIGALREAEAVFERIYRSLPPLEAESVAAAESKEGEENVEQRIARLIAQSALFREFFNGSQVGREVAAFFNPPFNFLDENLQNEILDSLTPSVLENLYSFAARKGFFPLMRKLEARDSQLFWRNLHKQGLCLDEQEPISLYEYLLDPTLVVPPVFEKASRKFSSALVEAAREGHLEIVRYLLGKMKDRSVMISVRFSITRAYLTALQFRRFEIANLFLDLETNPFARDSSWLMNIQRVRGESLASIYEEVRQGLIEGIRTGNHAFVPYLTQRITYSNNKEIKEMLGSLLLTAVANGLSQTVIDLLDPTKNRYIRQMNAQVYTAFKYAAEKGDSLSFAHLLDHVLAMEAGQLILEAVQNNPGIEGMLLFLNLAVDLHNPIFLALTKAAKHQNLAVIEFLLDPVRNPNHRPGSVRELGKAMRVAAERARWGVVDLFLNEGKNPYAREEVNKQFLLREALCGAARGGHLQWIKERVNKTIELASVFQEACIYRRREVISYLADPENSFIQQIGFSTLLFEFQRGFFRGDFETCTALSHAIFSSSICTKTAAVITLSVISAGVAWYLFEDKNRL